MNLKAFRLFGFAAELDLHIAARRFYPDLEECFGGLFGSLLLRRDGQERGRIDEFGFGGDRGAFFGVFQHGLVDGGLGVAGELAIYDVSPRC